VLFVERANELVKYSKAKSNDGAVVKARINSPKLVILPRPETRWSIHGQDEATVKGSGGPNTPELQHRVMSCG